MTDENSTPTPEASSAAPADAAASSSPYDQFKTTSSVAMAAIAGVGLMIWAILGKKVRDPELDDRRRELALEEQLRHLRAVRELERVEEEHRCRSRYQDELITAQLAVQQLCAGEGIKHEAQTLAARAEQRAAIAQEDAAKAQTEYWLKSTIVDLEPRALLLAKRMFEPHLQEHPKFGEYIEALSKIVETKPE